MSDSKARPSDAEITRALRDAVLGFFKANDTDSMTLKSVRGVATQKLKLAPEFFKADPKWKDKSKEIVTAEVDRLENTYEPDSSPAVSKSSTATKPTSPPRDKSTKRKSPDTTSPPAKRQKKAPQPSSPPRPAAKPTPKPAQPTASTSPKSSPTPPKPSAPVDPDSGSALSSPVSTPPPPRPTNPTPNPKPKPHPPKRRRSSTSAANPHTLNPDDEELKKLQSQLQKCGVRKLWGKELAKFDTPREKIAHLRGLLRDVGMEGRFSEDRARQIREERELKADLEAIQEGNKVWGKRGAQKEEGEKGPRRRSMAKGLQELQAFAGDEESD